MFSRSRRAGVGGARLYRHRLRVLGKVFDMSAGAEQVWRASGEAILAATLLVFLFAYLNLNRWHVRYAHIAVAWLVFLGALVAVAVVDPSIASGVPGCRCCSSPSPGSASSSSRLPGLRPRGPLDPDLVPAGLLGRRRRPRSGRLGDQRHRGAGAARRPGARCHADRLHRHAARLRRRHHSRHRIGRGAPRARADRRRRPDLGLGRRRRQRVHQPGNRTRTRPQARHPGRTGGAVARGAPSARPRPLPRLPRQRGRAASQPAGAGLPTARARRGITSGSP